MITFEEADHFRKEHLLQRNLTVRRFVWFFWTEKALG